MGNWGVSEVFIDIPNSVKKGRAMKSKSVTEINLILRTLLSKH